MAPELNRNLPAKLTPGQIIGYQPSTGGRPAYQIDWQSFEELVVRQNTCEDVAAILRIDPNTLQKAVQEHYNMTFAAVFESKRGEGRGSLRGALWKKAIDKEDITAQIWLSKQYLGMTDKSVNLNLTADLGNVPEEKKQAISRVLDALYDDDKV
jgi:hypothetical protein